MFDVWLDYDETLKTAFDPIVEHVNASWRIVSAGSRRRHPARGVPQGARRPSHPTSHFANAAMTRLASTGDRRGSYAEGMRLLRVVGVLAMTALALVPVLACNSTNGGCSDTESQPPCGACPGSPPNVPSCEDGEWICPPAGPCASGSSEDASTEDAGACKALSCGGEINPDASSESEPIPCDPDAGEPCNPGKDNNPCVMVTCDPNQRVCVWVPVEPVPSGCVGADAAADAGDASSDAADAAGE
jgi:hypothetical protein